MGEGVPECPEREGLTGEIDSLRPIVKGCFEEGQCPSVLMRYAEDRVGQHSLTLGWEGAYGTCESFILSPSEDGDGIKFSKGGFDIKLTAENNTLSAGLGSFTSELYAFAPQENIFRLTLNPLLKELVKDIITLPEQIKLNSDGSIEILTEGKGIPLDVFLGGMGIIPEQKKSGEQQRVDPSSDTDSVSCVQVDKPNVVSAFVTNHVLQITYNKFICKFLLPDGTLHLQAQAEPGGSQLLNRLILGKKNIDQTKLNDSCIDMTATNISTLSFMNPEHKEYLKSQSILFPRQDERSLPGRYEEVELKGNSFVNISANGGVGLRLFKYPSNGTCSNGSCIADLEFNDQFIQECLEHNKSDGAGELAAVNHAPDYDAAANSAAAITLIVFWLVACLLYMNRDRISSQCRRGQGPGQGQGVQPVLAGDAENALTLG
jgi:hypothetical protein